MRYNKTLHHNCEDCGSEFAIHYNEFEVEADPINCPFCAAYLIELDEEFDETEDE